MITIKNKKAAEKMAIAGKKLSLVFKEISEIIVSGITTLELDNSIEQRLNALQLIPQTKGYMGYKHATCISINNEIVHGVPSAEKVLKNGDLVKVDVCAAWGGYCADMTRCFFVGDERSSQAQNLVDVANASLEAGIKKAVVGGRLTDISAAIEQEIKKSGFGIVEDFAGHGIGKKMHEDPEILNYGEPGMGPVIKAGMAFAIEQMITLGNPRVKMLRDGWTAVTADGSLAAHVEDTVFITDEGPLVLTRG